MLKLPSYFRAVRLILKSDERELIHTFSNVSMENHGISLELLCVELMIIP